MVSFNTLLPIAFYGYCCLALFYLLKFGINATFRSVANVAVALLLAYLYYQYGSPAQ